MIASLLKWGAQFRTNEDGALTVFGLFVFLVMAVVSALAIDVSHLYSVRNQLQITADAAAHAALYHRNGHTAGEARDKALEAVEAMMPQSRYGVVLDSQDILFGTYDPSTESFTVDEDSIEAVMIQTGRISDRSNSVSAWLFRFVGADQFDVITPAIFSTYRPTCFREGMVANGIVDIQSNNGFTNGFCLHSNTYVSINSNNTFEPGTIVSMPNMSQIDLPQSGFETNLGLQAALRSGSYRLRLVNMLPEMITSLSAMELRFMPDYITNFHPVNTSGRTLDESDFIAGRVHFHSCHGSGRVTIAASVPISEVVFITNCKVKFANGSVLHDSLFVNSNTSATSFNSPSGLQLGRDDNCADGGGAQLLTLGSVDVASALQMYGGQIVAAGDIEFAANANGIEGASMVAGGEIDGTSNMNMGFCGTGMDTFEADYFRLSY